MKLFLLTFLGSINFLLLGQKGTIKSASISDKNINYLKLMDNPEYNNFFVLMDSKVGVMDYNFNLKYTDNAKLTGNTFKVVYQDKLLFFKYKYDGDKRLFGYYITKIATQDEVLDTLVPFIETRVKDEKKYMDKKTQQIVMRVLPSPKRDKVAVIHENNYKEGVKEGFKYQLLNENGDISEVKQISFPFEDITSEISSYNFDGENIYCLVHHYQERHTKKNNPTSYSIIKHNIISNEITMGKKINIGSNTRISHLDFYYYKGKIFLFNAFFTSSDNLYSIQKLKLIRINEKLAIEDSLIVSKSELDKLSIQNALTKDNYSGFRVAQRINPSTLNDFPDYLLNYQYWYLKADWKTYSHLLLTGIGGIPMFGSKKRFDCTTSNLLIYDNGKNTKTFNDTITGVKTDIVNYLMTKKDDEIELLHNSFTKGRKNSIVEKITFENNILHRTVIDAPIIRAIRKINLENGNCIYPIIDEKNNYLIKSKQ